MEVSDVTSYVKDLRGDKRIFRDEFQVLHFSPVIIKVIK
jgi:hypothetical protein